jgi:hypothetical protein
VYKIIGTIFSAAICLQDLARFICTVSLPVSQHNTNSLPLCAKRVICKDLDAQEKEMYASLLSSIAHITAQPELIDDLFGSQPLYTQPVLPLLSTCKPLVYLLLPILVGFICCTEARTSLDIPGLHGHV